jgi:outer membrane protein
MRKLLVALLLLLAARARASTLTLDQALQRASAQPELAATIVQTDSAHAQVDSARAAYWPDLGLSASYGTGGNPFADTGRAGLSTSILIWDFGKTASRVEERQAGAATADASLVQARRDLTLAVTRAYLAARAAKALVAVAQDTLANQQRHLDQIAAFVEVGRRPEIDRQTARTQVASASVEVIKARNAYDDSRSDLARVIGDPELASWDIDDASAMPAVPGETAAEGVLAAEALHQRSDLVALADAERGASLGASAARKAWRPDLRASAGIDAATDFDHDPSWGWNAGLSLSWSIFDAGRSSAIRIADNDVAIAAARREGLAQDIRVAVQKARRSVDSAKAVASAAREAADAARQQLSLAEARYAQGVGTIIELGDAQVAVAGAEAQVVNADFALASARAELVHALGR